MSIGSEKDLVGLMRIGRIVGLCLQEMIQALRPGITTTELDAIGEKFLTGHGARSAPIITYNYPGWTCISINDEVAHGIPGKRVVQDGDLVNIDVSAELNGFFADTGASVPVPPVAPDVQMLCDCTQKALQSAIKAAHAGARMNSIGAAVEHTADQCGLNIIRELNGHGVGRKLHEEPRSVFNYYTHRAKNRLVNGMVFTLEPFLTLGSGRIYTEKDGWTLKTQDHKLGAQYEHTIVVTEGAPILVTAV
jgi:methionyl aminopeptidase